MANYYSKKNNGHPFWTTLGVIFLVLIVLAGITALSGYFLGWFNKSEDETDDVIGDVENNTETGSRDDSNENLAFGISTYNIDPLFYDTYGIDLDCQSAYLLTANLNGTYLDPRVDWYITWDTSYTGVEDVQDYVKLDYYSNFTLEATLTCYQPFDYVIWVVAYRTAFPDVYCKCQLDYFASAETIVSAEFNEETLSIDVSHEDSIGIGTIKGTFDFNDDVCIVADDITIANIEDVLDSIFGETNYFYVTLDNGIFASLSTSSFSDVFSFVYGTSQLQNLDYNDFINQLCNAVLTGSSSSFDKSFGGDTGSWLIYSYFSIATFEYKLATLEDIYYSFFIQDWDFAVEGSLTYSTSIGDFIVPFETRVLVSGGSFQITGDDATLSLDSNSLIFGK